MSSSERIRDRLEFLAIDEQATVDLQAARTLLEHEFDTLLEAFYERVLAHPELKALFADDATVARARAAQKKHWLKALFAGGYDDSFIDKAEQIGSTHASVGLNLSWYLGGYCQMLVHFIDVLSRNEGPTSTRQIQAVCKAVFLDVDLVADAYLEAKNHDMRSILRRVGTLSRDLEALSIGLRLSVSQTRTAADAALRDAAPAAENGAADVASSPSAELQKHLESVEEQAEQITKRLDALQFGDRLHIDDEAPASSGTFRRIRGLLFPD